MSNPNSINLNNLDSRYTRVQPESYEVFTGKANGTPTVDDTNGTWLLADNGQPGAPMTVVSGALTNTASGTSITAGYAQRQLAHNVTRIGAKMRFGAYTTPDGVGCLAIWNARITSPPLVIPNAALHFVMGPASWSLGYYDTTFHNLSSGTFAIPLTANGTATHRVDITVNYTESSLSVILPDGTTSTVSDSHVAQYAGPYACWEVYANVPTTDSSVAFIEVWADSTPELMRSEILSRETLVRAIKAVPKPKAIQYAPGSGTTISAPTSVASIDSTNLLIPNFVVPDSGSFMVVLNGCVTMSGSTIVLWGVALRTGSSGTIGSLLFSDQVVNQQYNGRATVMGIVSNQSPGNTVDIIWQHFATTASTAGFTYGGSAGPATMTAIPLG